MQKEPTGAECFWVEGAVLRTLHCCCGQKIEDLKRSCRRRNAGLETWGVGRGSILVLCFCRVLLELGMEKVCGGASRVPYSIVLKHSNRPFCDPKAVGWRAGIGVTKRMWDRK